VLHGWDAIIGRMINNKQSTVGVGPTLAFAFVVMAVLLSVFGTFREFTNIQIGAIVLLGICYVFLGIYGYHICTRTEDIRIAYLYFLCQLLIGGSMMFLSNGVGVSPMLFLPIIGQSVVTLQPRPMITINAVIAVIYFGCMRYFISGWVPFWNSIPFFLAGQILLILFLQLVTDEDRIHNENSRLVKELESANIALKEYADQVEELTVTRERNRMAREIHDGVGHYLTVIHMQIQAAEAIMDHEPNKARETLKRAMHQAQEALREIRNSVSILRDMPEESISMENRLLEFEENLRDSNIQPHTSVLGDMRKLPPQYEQTIIRTMQEGIQNCIKHAEASNIWIVLDYTYPDVVKLNIRDDGKGSQSPSNTGFGLISLQERVRLLDGKFITGNHVDGGFSLEVEVPG
jgi:signal transduction histidine kinase